MERGPRQQAKQEVTVYPETGVSDTSKGVSKVPEGLRNSLSAGGGGAGHQSPPPQYLAPSFLVLKGVEAPCRAHPGCNL